MHRRAGVVLRWRTGLTAPNLMGAHAAEPVLPGRSCPLDYRYAPAVFRREPAIEADALLIAGGVYGNPFALTALEALLARECGKARLVLNGDFNWFDVTPERFRSVNERALAHVVLRGNVETELANDEDAAGCGCGYPEWVSDAEVERSNAILLELKRASRGVPPLRTRLGALPMHILARVGGLRIGIVHGDAWSLAGWSFGQERVDRESTAIQSAFAEAAVDVFASSHTCLPVAVDFAVDGRRRALINNGAAGMPNFAGTTFGLATRIGVEPTSHALYRLSLGPVFVEAIAVEYDQDAWAHDFAAMWPEGTPASLSYARRIREGPAYRLDQAIRGAFARV